MNWGIVDKTVSFAAGELPKSRGCVSPSASSVGELFRHRDIPEVGLGWKWKQAECESTLGNGSKKSPQVAAPLERFMIA